MNETIRSRVVWPLGLAFAICCAVSVIPVSSFGQITFERTYGGGLSDVAHSVVQTLDGGYAIAGFTWSSGAGVSDVYLIKTDSLGDVLWDSTYGGISYDVGYSVQQTFDGGYVITGYTRSSGAGLNDVYLIKTDSLGNTLWDTTYGGDSSDVGRSVVQTLDGGYIIAGETRSFDAGVSDVYVIKTDSLGNVLWDTTYGGSFDDFGYSVQQTSDSGYIIAGQTFSFGAVVGDVYLIKTDSLGNVLWDTTYGGGLWDIGYSVDQTSDGGYIIAGQTFSFGPNLGDIYLIKTDSLGSVLWDTTHGGDSSDLGLSVVQTLDEGYVVAGYTWSFGSSEYDIYIVKTDSVGSVLWERTYGDSVDDRGYAVQQTMDGGYIVAGYTRSMGAGVNDFYLIKTDANGMVVGLEEEGSMFKVEGSRVKLLQNMPNPFLGSTVITYSLPVPGRVRLQIYDVSGRFVETLVDEKQVAGIYAFRWEAADKATGMYFCRLEADDFTDVKKMILLQ